MGKDDTVSVSDHETHSSVFTQEEVVTSHIKAPWGRIVVYSDGLLHLKISRSFTEPEGTDFCVEDDLL